MDDRIWLPDGTTVLPNVLDDEFEKSNVANVPWSLTLANAATLALTSAAAEFITGGQAMKFTSGTSASSEIHKYLPIPQRAMGPRGGGEVGVEWIFSVMDENPSNLAFYVSYRDQANWIRAKLLHVFTTNVWSYQDSAGVQQALMTRDTSENTAVPRWHRVVMSIDVIKNTWKQLTIDEMDFSSVVSLLPLRNTADATAPSLLDFAVEFTNTATPGVLNIDSVRSWYR
jgi:hypothetical protein